MKRKADTFEGSGSTGPSPHRAAAFTQEVRALNTQFSRWVASQAAGASDKLWDAGARDYAKYASKLREEYADVISGGGDASHAGQEPGQCMVMGQGDMGQLGLGDDEAELLVPTMVKAPGGIKALQVACGGMHTLLLCEGGAVFSWGVNDEGALGRVARGGHLALQEGETEGDEARPERVNFPAGVQVKMLTAGDSHSAAITTNGKVFAWGIFRDSSGCFGFSPGVKVQNTPAEVAIPEKVSQIASGSDHILALASSGCVYSWGCAEFGRLGRLNADECDPKFKRDESAVAPWKARLLTPARMSGISGATYVAAGLYCSFAVCGREVMSCGVNNYGQMAIEEAGPFYEMTKVPLLSGKGVCGIGGGEHHTIFLTSAGQVLSCGRATYGRLGRSGVDCNADEKNPKPMPVMGFSSKVISVEAGLSVSGCICEDGGLYMWGSGGEGMLGNGSMDKDEHLPRKVAASGSILSVSIGGQHLAMIAKSGAGNKRQR